MLKTERMKQVVIAGAKPQLVPVIGTLHRLRVLHIEEHTPDDFFTYGDPLPEGNQVASTRLTARGLIKNLDLEDQEPAGGGTAAPKDIRDWQHAVEVVEDVNQAITGVVKELETARALLREKEQTEKRLKRLVGLGLRLEHLSGYRNLSVLLGTTPSDPEPTIREKIEDYDLHKSQEPDGTLIALFVPSEQAQRAEDVLVQVGFQALEAPEGKGAVDVAANQAVTDVNRVRNHVAGLETELANARKTHGRRLLAAEQMLSAAAERANAPLRFATSTHSFVVTGYVPNRRIRETENALKQSTTDELHIEWIDPEGETGPHHDPKAQDDAPDEDHTAKPQQTPSLFAHKRKGPRSFTHMLTMHSWPKYKEIDPTVLIYIAFPLFFAVMIGDLAFGILIMLVALYLKNHYPLGIGGPKVSRMLLLAGFWTAIFGVFVYGEAFGFHFVESPGHLSWEYALGMDWHNYYVGHGEAAHLGFQVAGTTIQLGYLSKLEDVLPLLAICVGIAIIHLNLALFIGIYNQWILHGPKHAILGRFSWVVMELGILGLAWGGHIGDSTTMLAGGAVLLIAVIMIIAGEGVIGALELPKLVSNGASYFRLAAVAMSKAGMALAVNSFAFVALTDTSYAVNGIGGWVLLVVGHTVILALGIIAGGLHAMRLQLVEFFGWFFEGGGRAFQAFGDPQDRP